MTDDPESFGPSLPHARQKASRRAPVPSGGQQSLGDEAGLVLLLFTDASRTDLGVLNDIRNLSARLLTTGMLLTMLLGALAALVLFQDYNGALIAAKQVEVARQTGATVHGAVLLSLPAAQSSMDRWIDVVVAGELLAHAAQASRKDVRDAVDKMQTTKDDLEQGKNPGDVRPEHVAHAIG